MNSLLRSLVLCLALAPPVAASDFTDFRVPEHRWMSWSGAAQFTGSRTTSLVGPADQMVGILTSRFATAWEADDRWLSVALEGNVEGNRNQTRRSIGLPSVPGGFQELTRSDQGVFGQRVHVSATARRYAGDQPFGAGLWAGWSAQHQRIWADDSRDRSTWSPTGSNRSWFELHDHDKVYGHATWGGVEIGIGRVRDATGVHWVDVLVHRLEESGALRRAPSRHARHRLAQLWYVRLDFAAAHDRPTRFFWREVERILLEDGALQGESLDAYSAFRGEESYEPTLRTFRRRVGFFVGPHLAAEVRRMTEREELSTTSSEWSNDSLISHDHQSGRTRVRRDTDEGLAGMGVEVHAAPAMAWQLDLRARASSPTRWFGEAVRLEGVAAITYVIADRWSVGSQYQFRHFTEPGGRSPRESEYVGITELALGFLVEDRTLCHLRLRDFQTERRNVSPPGQSRFQRQQSVDLSLSYRFAGLFEAPGLVESARGGQ